jgi:hypothetical protein
MYDRGVLFNSARIYSQRWWGSGWATDLMREGWEQAQSLRAVEEAFQRDVERQKRLTCAKS